MPVYPPGGGGAGGTQLSVSTQTLLDAAPTYQRASQNVSSIQQAIDNATQLASGDMAVLQEFAELSARLNQLKQAIDMSMQCAARGLNMIGDTLIIAADDYQGNEQQIGTSFQQIEDDTQITNTPTTTIPTQLHLPNGTSPFAPQQPTQPTNPTQQKPGTLPVMNPIIEPGV